MPNRIMIVGCPGAGKSTLARQLHKITGHELITLDEFYYTENWTEPKPEEWIKKVRELADRPKWIMDGNYNSSMNIRIERADMVIFLDYPTHILLWRVFIRTFNHLGKTRPGMPSNCPERFDRKFFNYVYTFNRTRKAELLKRLNQHKNNREIVVLKSLNSISAFVRDFKKTINI